MSDNRQQYFVAAAVIFNDEGKVLITKRHSPSNPEVHNKWQFPGGSVDYGEHPKEAALREIQEETGLTIQITADKPVVFSHVFKNHQAHIVLMVYKAQFVSGELNISHDLEETSEAQWVDPQEIASLPTLPQTQETLEEILKL